MSTFYCVPCAKKNQIDLDDVFRVAKCSVCGMDNVEVGIEFVSLVSPPIPVEERKVASSLETIELDLSRLQSAFIRIMTEPASKRALMEMANDLVGYLAGEKTAHPFTIRLNYLLQAIAESQK